MKDIATGLIHHPYQAPAGYEAVPVGVHKGSTVIFPNVAALRSRTWRDKSAYTYGLHGTPTTFTLEERLATLEGGRYCTLAPSGLAAIAMVDCAFLQQGDEVLVPDNAYGPGKGLASHELSRFGVILNTYDAMDPADLAGRLTPAARLVWLEAAGSITLEFPDVPALVAQVRAHNARRGGDQRAVLTAIDNTWGAGVAFNAFDLGADIVMHALTKYPSGGADVLMGSVVTRDAALHERLMDVHMHYGWGVGANDAELVLRGLPTLALRYRAQDASTRALAQWMATQPEVVRVLHPAMSDSPGHDAWKRDADGAACLFSAVFRDDISQDSIDRFCDHLKLFRLGWSWAGPISLCAPYDVPRIRRQPWPHAGGLVRFAVGLEAVDALRADLEQALAAALR